MEFSLIKEIERLSKQTNNLVFSSIAKVLLNEIDNLKNFNITVFAKKANVSPASFLIFAKSLNFQGTKDLIPALIQEKTLIASKNWVNAKTDFLLEEKIEDYFTFVKNSLNFTKESNINSIIEFAKKLLNFKNKIYIIGKGANLDVINIFANYLSKNNYSVIHSYDFEVQQKWLKNFINKDIIVVFSYSSNSERINQIIKTAIDKKCFIVNFSANFISYIFKKANINFKVTKNEEVIQNQRTARIQFLFLVMLINISLQK